MNRPARDNGGANQVFTKFVGEMTVKPQGQARMPLGDFTPQRPAKGFSIEIEQASQTEDSVTTEINVVGSHKHYQFVLNAANYSDTPISIRVFAL